MKPLAAVVVFPFALLTAGMAAEADGALPKHSPFQQRGGPAATVATAHENIEFAGFSTVGKRTDLIFHDKTAKKNYWIAKGETKQGIEVLNFDEQRELATVKVNGVEKTLALRKASKPASAGRPAITMQPASTGFSASGATFVQAFPTPATNVGSVAVAPQSAPVPNAQPAAPQPATPEAQAQQKAETEARMLVSDLLEIGMAQRKAYEEAQRKAAQGTPATPQPETPKPSP